MSSLSYLGVYSLSSSYTSSLEVCTLVLASQQTGFPLSVRDLFGYLLRLLSQIPFD